MNKKEQHSMLVNIHAACQKLAIAGDQAENLVAIKNSVAMVANAIDTELKAEHFVANAEVVPEGEQKEKALKMLKKLEK